MLNGIDGPPSGSELHEFAQRPGPLGAPTLAVATVSEGPDGLVFDPGGFGRAPGDSSVDAQRGALVQRALRTRKMVTAVLKDGKASRLVIAVAGPGSARWVTLHESYIAPTVPISQAVGTPFSELRGAVFTSTAADDAVLLLTSEKSMPLSGHTVRTELPVGANTFVIVAKAREPLVGAFAAKFPLLAFLASLLVGVFATAATHVLTRRRGYALRLVDERTAELTASLAELTEARSALERMVTGGPTLVVKRDLSPPRITFVSPNIERILGHTVAAMMKEGFFNTHAHPDDVRSYADAIASVEANGTASQTIEVRLRDRVGEYRWISLQVWPDDVVDGRVVSVVSYVLDVNDRHKAEEAQAEAQQVAEAASNAKSKFLSHVSHELRTPLNAILGFGQLLQTDAITPDQHESVDQIVEGGRHLLNLVNELLDISSIESGYVRVAPEAMDPHPIIRDCVDLLAPDAERMNVAITVEVDDLAASHALVFADALRVKQIVLNLLSNAIKYNRKGGAVTVTTRALPDDRLAISIRDSGRGIAASRLSRLFTPFERLGAEDSDVDGIGLGLALARQLARAMNGDITVVTARGDGSTFTLELPSAAPPAEPVTLVEPGVKVAWRRETVPSGLSAVERF
jgi:PAS domain S-box-containing protein